MQNCVISGRVRTTRPDRRATGRHKRRPGGGVERLRRRLRQRLDVRHAHSGAGIDMRLPGQSLQLETGSLSQNGWRDYDPSLGRYIEGDPLGIDAGQNVYGYVDGDPLNLRDPSGLDTCGPTYDFFFFDFKVCHKDPPPPPRRASIPKVYCPPSTLSKPGKPTKDQCIEQCLHLLDRGDGGATFKKCPNECLGLDGYY